MSDQAFSLLRERMAIDQQHSRKALWLVDENLAAAELLSMAANDNLQCITNRCDLAALLESQGFSVQLNDFDFSVFDSQYFEVVYYRVGKEKALVHHIINSAAGCLETAGRLVLAGYKNEGTKTYIDKAAALYAGTLDRQRGANTAMLAAISKPADLLITADNRLDDKHYRDQHRLMAEDIEFISKPGLYGWNKIDKGSELLMEVLPTFLASLKQPPEKIADLGCGYGYLSVMASQQVEAHFMAVDNNIAAVSMCQLNFDIHQVSGNVLLSDAAQALEPPMDLVLCNPPFHRGFDVQGDLTDKFLQAAKRLVGIRGHAVFVVNGFIPLEKKARGLFNESRELANNGSFKVWVLK